MRDLATHPSVVALDELACLGSAGVDPAVAEHVAACADCRERVDAARAADADFRARHAARFAAPPVAPRPARRRRWIAPLAAAALVLVWLGAHWLPATDHPLGASSGDRAKGGSHLELSFRRDGVETTYEDQPLQPGDVLAFRYTTGYSYLLILLLEETGRIDVAVEDGGRSLAIQPGVGRTVSKGIELDGYLGSQLVVATFSDRPLASARLADAVRAAWAAAPPERRASLELGPLGVGDETFTWRIRTRQR